MSIGPFVVIPLQIICIKGQCCAACNCNVLKQDFFAFLVPDVTKVIRVVQGEPTITKVTRFVQGDPTITKVTRVVQGQPSTTKVTRVIEGQPSITKVTRVVSG